MKDFKEKMTNKIQKDQPINQPSVSDVSAVKKDLEKLAEEKQKPELVSQFKNLLAKKSAQVF